MITRRLEFDKLDQLYTALRDIDNVENSKSDCKLDDVWNVIKDIDKTQFDDGIEDDIVSSIRSAIEKIYLNYFNQVNSVIGLTPDDFKKEEENNSLKVVGMPQVQDTRNKGVI